MLPNIWMSCDEIRVIDGQQFNHLIYQKLSDVICLPINYCITQLRFGHFSIFLFRAFLH